MQCRGRCTDPFFAFEGCTQAASNILTISTTTLEQRHFRPRIRNGMLLPAAPREGGERKNNNAFLSPSMSLHHPALPRAPQTSSGLGLEQFLGYSFRSTAVPYRRFPKKRRIHLATLPCLQLHPNAHRILQAGSRQRWASFHRLISSSGLGSLAHFEASAVVSCPQKLSRDSCSFSVRGTA